MIRDVGDQVTLSVVLRDAAGVVNNAATAAVLVTKPDGSTASPGVTNTGSGGVYTATVTPDQPGTWLYKFTFSGAVVAVQADQFSVVTAGRVLVASMEELRAQLRRTDTTDDQALRSYLVSATDRVEDMIGGPVAPATFAEPVEVCGDIIVPRNRPLVSVTSLTPDLGTAVDASSYTADTAANVVRLRWWVDGLYTLVYRAGLSTISERVKLAGLIITQHLWRVENGGAGLPYPGDGEQVFTPSGFAIPSRAAELLAPDTVGGIA